MPPLVPVALRSSRELTLQPSSQHGEARKTRIHRETVRSFAANLTTKTTCSVNFEILHKRSAKSLVSMSNLTSSIARDSAQQFKVSISTVAPAVVSLASETRRQ